MTSDFPLRNECFWANLEPVKGSEQGRSRPVFIVSNNLMNKFSPVVLAVPMSTAEEKVRKGPFNVSYEGSDVDVDNEAIDNLKSKGFTYANTGGVILCNQARAISKQRLIERIGAFRHRHTLKKVEEALIDSFGLMACSECDIPLRPLGLSCAECGTVYRKKCVSCRQIVSLEHNYCSNCGGRV